MSGWGGYGGDKSGLVEQVKEWQRQSPGHKKAWDNYCHENGHPKFDPNLKDAAFLQGFLDAANAGQIAPTEGTMPIMVSGGVASSLVEQVKSIQRQGYGFKQAWYKFLKQNGSQDFDPARHDESTLQTFISGVASGAIQPCEDEDYSGGSGGWGGGGGGSWGGGGGGGNDWWNMDPWQMMQMMKGMMGKMAGGGKGGGGGKKGGGSKGGGGGPPVTGEIRYDDPNHTAMALQTLNGALLQGSPISLEYDPKSQDGSKLLVSGIPAGTQWQELKDLFSPIGTVAYAGVKDDSAGDMFSAMMGSGKGKGKGKGKKGFSAY